MSNDDDLHGAVKRAVTACAVPNTISGLDDATLFARAFTDMGFDSLAMMEFCVSIHLDTGKELTSEQVSELGSPGAVIDHLRSTA